MKQGSGRITATLALALLALLVGTDAAAQSYPTRPIRMLIPYPPGGGLDIFGRSFATKMAENLGQPIVIENRPGASTMIAAEALAKSPADGYTMILGDMATFAINPLLYKKLPYDPFRDFAPIALAIRAALMLTVNPGVPANSVQELVAHLKARPGQLNYGSPGPGSPHHLAMEMFKQRTGVAATHIAYKGAAAAVQDLLPGQIQLMFLDLGSAGPHIKSGKIRALGVGNAQRLASMNDIPTVAESGVPGFDAFGWGAIAAPAGTPKDLIARLNSEFAKASSDPALRERFSAIGFDVLHSTPEGLTDYMRAETEKWAKVIREGNITVE
jgi:tripartite-type tricarboxylate transporter receptor subunit TctC